MGVREELSGVNKSLCKNILLVRPFSIMANVKNKKSLLRNFGKNFSKHLQKLYLIGSKVPQKLKVKSPITQWDANENFTMFCVSKIEADF